ncbi:MAG: DNA repair protein RecO [Bacteroidales bacterium]|nr:DNA repair protein RecO [Bacteroidales bacterium]
MIVKTKAIVLKKIPYGDSSLIVQLFTEQLGRQSVIIKGCRSQKTKAKVALFQPSTLLKCEFSFKEKNKLHPLQEVNIDTAYKFLYSDISKTSVAVFLCELITRSIKEEEPQIDVFQFIHQSFTHIDDTENNIANFPLFFMLKLLPYLGFKPGENYSSETPFFNIREGVFMPVYTTDYDTCSQNSSHILFQLMQANISNYQNIKIQNSQRAELTQKMLNYYNIHIESFGNLKSLQILHEVLNSN